MGQPQRQGRQRRRPLDSAAAVALMVALVAVAGGLLGVEIGRRAAIQAEREQARRWWARLEAGLANPEVAPDLPDPPRADASPLAWQHWTELAATRSGRPLCRVAVGEGPVLASAHWPASVGMQLARPDPGQILLGVEPLERESRLAAMISWPLEGVPTHHLVTGVFLDGPLLCPWEISSKPEPGKQLLGIPPGAETAWLVLSPPAGGWKGPWRAAVPAVTGGLLAGGLAWGALRAGREALARVQRSAARLHPDLARRGSPGFSTDALELEALLGALARQRAQLAARLRAARRLAGWRPAARALAHDVRNALTPVRISLEMAARRDGESAPQGGAGGGPRPALVREALRALDAAEILLEEFSDFARLPEGVLSTLDLRDWLPEVVARWMPAKPTALALPPGPVPVEVDAARLERAVGNLLRNALEAAGEAEIGVSLTVSGGPASPGEGGQGRERLPACISVWNVGAAVPAGLGPRIFTEGVSTKLHGSGLGLAIARSVALQMGGALDYRNTAEGVAFDLRLPLAPQPPRDDAERPSS